MGESSAARSNLVAEVLEFLNPASRLNACGGAAGTVSELGEGRCRLSSSVVVGRCRTPQRRPGSRPGSRTDRVGSARPWVAPGPNTVPHSSPQNQAGRIQDGITWRSTRTRPPCIDWRGVAPEHWDTRRIEPSRTDERPYRSLIHHRGIKQRRSSLRAEKIRYA